MGLIIKLKGNKKGNTINASINKDDPITNGNCSFVIGDTIWTFIGSCCFFINLITKSLSPVPYQPLSWRQALSLSLQNAPAGAGLPSSGLSDEAMAQR